jgi:O-methyltransferase involved in polyketide biosynthesis
MSTALIVQSRRTARQATVPFEHVISLIARASARDRFAELGFADPTAEQLLEDLEGAQAQVCEARLRATILATMAIDDIVRDFFHRNRGGIAIAFHPGLCSRFSRIDDGELSWVDIDTPEIAALKCATLESPPRHAIAASCGCPRGWLSAVGSAGMPILFVHQGAARAADRFAAHFDGIVRFAPVGSEYVLDYDARLPLRSSSTAARLGCLEIPSEDGSVVRYPRAKLVAVESRQSSVAHVRLV